MKKKSIVIPLESRLYLEDQLHLQRGGKHTSPITIERLTFQAERDNNKFILTSGDLGGAIGDPKNSYEEGRWTSWSVDEMKEMLDKAGLPYKDGDPVEEISIYF